MNQTSVTLAVVLLLGVAVEEGGAQDAVLAAGERFQGKVAFVADEDRVEFSVLGGSRVTVKAAALPGEKVRPRVVLVVGGETIAVPKARTKIGGHGKWHKLKRVPISTAGPIEAVVVGQGGKLGTYELTIEEFLPSKAKAKFALANEAAAELPFLARAGASATAVISAKGKGPSLASPVLRAPSGESLDLTGLVLPLSDGRRLEIGPVPLPETGTYVLEVANDGAGTEKVKVRVDLSHAPLAGGLVVEDPGHATVSGSLTLGDGSWLPGADASSQSFADGEVLVRLAPGDDAASVAAALGATIVGRAPNGWVRLRSPDARPHALGAPGSARRTAGLVTRARALDRVVEAQPNHVRTTFAPPSDAMYAEQWDFPRCRLDEAWAVTTGDASRCIAVLDTGVRAEHPDLAGRLYPGYDFVDEPWNAGDGDGIDGDPRDEFLSLGTHGTHVIGTIAAGFDNGVGVAGAVPDVKVLPVRVLGVLGGTDFDIAQGVLYAAGLPNVSGKLPPVTADVINMSLGGPNPSEILHQAIRDAVDAGVIVVAAAGNAGTTKPFYPAAYPEVVTVTATNVLDALADYSSTGAHVDLCAPGGEKLKDLDQNGQLDGIVSTIVHPQLGPTYAQKSGTSMAAPHVAAAAFLVRAAVPDLPEPLVRAALAAAAVDLGEPGPDPQFGVGRLDVAGALDVALGTASGPAAPFLHEAPLRFAGHQSDRPLAFVNRGGGGPIAVTGVTSDAPWLVPVQTTGTSPCVLGIHAEKAGLAPGAYAATLTVETTAGVLTVPVEMEVAFDGPVPISRVFVLAVDVVTGMVAGGVAVTEETADSFTLDPLPEGTYRIVAVTDLDLDGVGGELHDYAGLANLPEGGAAAIPLPDGEALTGAQIEVLANAPSILPGGVPLVLPEGL